MKTRMAAGLLGAALVLAGGAALADERGVQIKNLESADDAYVSIVDRNDHDRVILDHYRINHGETYSVVPTFARDHSYYLHWHAERTSDGKSKDGDCGGQGTPCEIDLYGAR
jgi:hypothetical protein